MGKVPAHRKRPSVTDIEVDASPNKKMIVEPVTPLISDRLGTLVTSLCAKFNAATNWEEFVHEVHGRSYLSERIDDIKHPAQ